MKITLSLYSSCSSIFGITLNNALFLRALGGFAMIVMKFGGTSVGSAESIRGAVEIVRKAAGSGKKPFVIVSAVSGVTNLLLASARKALERGVSVKDIIGEIESCHLKIMDELGVPAGIISDDLAELEHVLFGIALLRELTPRTLDYAASFGERISSKIVACYARNAGLSALPFNAYSLGMVTDANFGGAEILPETNSLIAEAVAGIPQGVVPIVTGYIGRTASGDFTTLGRGGSDYTAAIYGAALNASEIQIWTDVDGVMTADPRIVQDARTVDVVSFEEASELAYFGARVLHPKTILPAMNKDIPVKVLNTFNPAGKGTTILRKAAWKNDITAITCKKNILVININSARMMMAYGFMHSVFRLFDEFHVPVDMISTSEVNVSLTVEKQFDVSGLVGTLKEFAEVTLLSDRASISIVGEGIRSRHGVGSRIFSVFGRCGINVEMTSQSYHDVNESVVIREKDVDAAVRALHDEFFGNSSGGEKFAAAAAVKSGVTGA